jgi:hypothetical protein
MDVDEGLGAITETVSRWLEKRLDAQLAKARTTFKDEVGAALAKSLGEEKTAILSSAQFRTSDVEKVVTALDAELMHRVEELVDWFRGFTGTRPPLTIREIKMAADGLFETYIDNNRLRTMLPDHQAADETIAADRVRLGFDLMVQAVHNALEYSKSHAERTGLPVRVRIGSWRDDHCRGLVFSNLHDEPENLGESRIAGEKYSSATDAIFRDRNSGLSKIAALSATIMNRDCSVRVEKRARSFHLFVPLWPA